MRFNARFSQAVILFSLLWAGLSGCVKQADQTIEIKADGTASVTTHFVMTHDSAVQMLEFERVSADRNSEGGQAGAGNWKYIWAEGYAPPATQPGAASQPAAQEVPAAQMSDDQLLQAVRRAVEKQAADNATPGTKVAVTREEMSGKDLDVTVRTDAESLKALLQAITSDQTMGMLTHVRLEKNDQGKLVFTYGQARPSDIAARQMANSGMLKGSLTVIMPGDIRSSSLPQTQGRQTSMSFDLSDADSKSKLIALLRSPLVVVADPGQLDMASLPLDSTGLSPLGHMARAAAANPAAQGPIADAGPGFLVEASGVTITRSHEFKEGKDLLPDVQDDDEPQAECLVEVRLFSPEHRQVLSVGGATVTRALDDKNRPIPLVEQEGQDSSPEPMIADQGNPNEPESARKSAPFSLHLAPPKADARSIQVIEGKVVATTFSGWLEHKIDKLAGQPDQKIDLGDLIPGASATLLFVRRQQPPTSQPDNSPPVPTPGVSMEVKLMVSGPESVKSLDIKIKDPAARWGNSSAMSDSSVKTDAGWQRTLLLEYSTIKDPNDPRPSTPVLIIRCPKDPSRQSVPFKLESLDLF